jgi:large subunit ribosomal protein L12
MNYVYGALLLHSAGKPIDEAHLKKVVTAAGENADEAKIKALVSALEGVNIEEAISKAAMPVAVAAAPAAGGTAPVKEEKNEEDAAKKAEEAAEGLSSLFG